MDKTELICNRALALVGNGYVYGAKGQTCTAEFRAKQAVQYPDQAKNLLSVCARWDGLPVWDCAQLTREAAKAAGISLPSGASSQWQSDAWTQKGERKDMPPKETLFVFREGNGKMQHTGLCIGDGTCVHAKGSAYGVVREDISQVGWTHWARLKLCESETRIVTASSGSSVNARKQPNGSIIARIPIGTQVEVTHVENGWASILWQGQTLYMQLAFLKTSRENSRLDALEERVAALERRMNIGQME